MSRSRSRDRRARGRIVRSARSARTPAVRPCHSRRRLRIARAAQRIGRLRAAEHADRTFGDLLRSLGQRDEEIERFWDVFIRPALNLPAAEAGADYGIFTVQTALLAGPEASELLLPTEPLGEMHGTAAGRALEAAGATVHSGVRVNALDELDADAVVVATGPGETARLLGEPIRPFRFTHRLVHLLFDRPLLEHPFAALPESRALDLRPRRPHRPPAAQGPVSTVVSSGAPELLEIRGRELVELIADAVRERLGNAGSSGRARSREPHATFAPRPGTGACRSAETSTRGVVLAGAWTESDWPATMSQVASGERAAQLLLSLQATRAAA